MGLEYNLHCLHDPTSYRRPPIAFPKRDIGLFYVRLCREGARITEAVYPS